MWVRHASGDGGPHLPDLVNRQAAVRNLQFGEEPHDAVRGLGLEVPHFEGDFGLRDGPDGGDVVGLDGHYPTGFERDEGLGALHARPSWVDGPRDPAVGFGRRGDEGNGEGRVGLVVGPVEVGGEHGKVQAAFVEMIVGEGLWGAGERVGRRDYQSPEGENQNTQSGGFMRRHWCFYGERERERGRKENMDGGTKGDSGRVS